MQDHELTAWLGDTETTAEQRDAIRTAADTISRRWPDPDLADLREAALNAAAQVILGDETLETIGGEYITARAREREAHAALTGALIATQDTEVRLAERAGVTRMTVRKALGKR